MTLLLVASMEVAAKIGRACRRYSAGTGVGEAPCASLCDHRPIAVSSRLAYAGFLLGLGGTNGAAAYAICASIGRICRRRESMAVA